MRYSCVTCCAALVALAAVLVPLSPWLAQRAFWYAHQAPASQARNVATSPPSLHYNLVRGTPAVPFVTDVRMDFLEHNFTHVPGDVWITTWQKVGTTWTQYIVSLLLGHPPATSMLDLFDHCPWPEVGIGLFAKPTDALQRSASGAAGPRCFKSHWPNRDFFTKLPDSSKVVYVLRDAEDVAVSYWNHLFNYFGFFWVKPGEMSWDTYFEKFISGEVENGGYMEHVASWWEVRDRPNVLIVRYEDLRRDTVATIRRLAAFIGVGVSDDRMAEILDATSKPRMRAWNDGFVDNLLIKLGIMSGDHVRNDGDKKLVGFSDEQRARVVEKYEALLKPAGVPFEYMFKSGKKV